MSFAIDLEAYTDCPQCGCSQAPEECFLGVLGNRVHFRCACCGWDWIDTIEDD